MKILILFIITTILYANSEKRMYNLYQHKKFSKACDTGFYNISKYSKNENFVSLYAFSCLKADQIDRLALAITKLKKTKESRKNAVYFSIILMQKKLLYYALIDGFNLSKFNFPSTKHIISKVFDFYAQLNIDKVQKYYIFQDKNDKLLKYKLYLLDTKDLKKMIIEEIYNNKLIKKHSYW
ncbi:MAG: hypothetical protein ABGW74_02810 [Campylobacterales bacterium]